ncbi:serine--tRNA ligase [Eubacterium saphenum ATCC 49989]|nr:serine--tRNA ligase [Eubacterium saphenum ATCC 49989]
MLDIKKFRIDSENFIAGIKRRGKGDFGSGSLAKLDEQRRAILKEVEALKNKKKTESAKIPELKKQGQDVDGLLAEMKKISDKTKELDKEVAEIEDKIEDLLLGIPNIPHESVPDGKDDSANVEIRKIGEVPVKNFREQAHWELGDKLDILDFERAGKITGSRFTVYKGLGARLERSVINFMLNTHVDNGYTEVMTPFMVNRRAMTGTGQLPKFEEDLFAVNAKDYFLIPTAEVPVTNLHSGEILNVEEVPKNYVAYTACFRKEAGAAGRDTKGLIRQHQFNKVELVKLVQPENSYEELDKLLANAESILKKLELPYRVVKLCTGDLGFSAAMTYDIEVWMPSYGRYVEISSCSNFEDYQARRANIRMRNADNKPVFVHTLNGSGLAVGRTVAAILENCQQEDGSIKVPDVLQSYMGRELIK